MDSPSEQSSPRVNRRAVLAGLAAGGLTATSGCVRQVRSALNREHADQLSLTITTVPADVDEQTVRIANTLQKNLEAVGIDASIDHRSIEEFYRSVLINHSFDLFVGLHPGAADPDFLYEALHSVYASESGWQNPFGFTNMAFDTQLERQRLLEGEPRRRAVRELLESLAAEQPFVPICIPEENRLVRTDRFDGWDDHHLATRLGYLGLEPEEPAEEVRGVITDPRATQNLNPLNVEYRNRGLYIDLLYDSLATIDRSGGGEAYGESELVPWLAESWGWEGATATVTLRPNLTFHDGEPLTADDVAFTYRLLEDTTLEEGSVRSPAPRYRGAVAAVEAVEAVDDRTVRFTVSTSHTVAERAFTVPILPAHVWEERAEEADVPGVSVAQGTTDAIVTDNVPPVGSGPYEFVDRTERETMEFERFDDHFSLREFDGGNLPSPTVETFTTNVEPSSESAIEAIENGDADVTVTTLESHVVDSIEETENVRLQTSASHAFYLIGFNVRNAPFGNPYFRRTVARLIDKQQLVEDDFEGRASPVATPLPEGEPRDGDETDRSERDDETNTGWVPEHLRWNGEDPEVPFFGSEGELNASTARLAFEEIGYQYDDEGTLLVRE